MLAISGGGAFGWLFIQGARVVLLENDPRYELPPCFEVGAPFHHRFKPNCVGELKTPNGPKPLSVNEDGLREIARPHVLKSDHRVLVLGDSFVEGWWASREESLSSLLREKFPGVFFINGGLRSTGPVMQAENLRSLLRIYKPQGVIWFLNDTDPLDDRFACAIAESPLQASGALSFSTPEFELSSWQANLVSLLGTTASANRLRRRFYQGKWASLASGEAALRCDPCRGVKEFKRLVQSAALPLLAFYLHSKEGVDRKHYGNDKSLRPELQACLAKEKVPFLEAGLRHYSPEEVDRYLWQGDFHFNPEGTAMLTDQIAPEVERWLKNIGGSHGKRRAR